MIKELLREILPLVNKDMSLLNSGEFSKIIKSYLKQGTFKKEVSVLDRGDGRGGRVDLVYQIDGKRIGIELDRLKPRTKSIFKLKQLKDVDYRVVITRKPVTIIEI